MFKTLTARIAAAALIVTVTGGTVAFLETPATAADSCSGTANFDWASQWDSLFLNAQAWQYPGTSSCLTASNGLGSKKLDGKLYQKDGQITFGVSDGPLTRSELRSKGVTNRDGSVTGQVYARIATGGRKFTVAQLLNTTPSVNGGGQDPIVRLEIEDGVLDIVYYDNNGSSSKRISNALTGIDENDSFTFEIRQYAGSSNNNFDIEVKVNGATKLSRRTVTGYDSSGGYFKAGCYINTGGGTGCKSSFSSLAFNL